MTPESFFTIQISRRYKGMGGKCFHSQELKTVAITFERNIDQVENLRATPGRVAAAVYNQSKAWQQAVLEVTKDPKWSSSGSEEPISKTVVQRYHEIYSLIKENEWYDAIGGEVSLIHVKFMNQDLPLDDTFKTITTAMIISAWAAYEALAADLTRIYRHELKIKFEDPRHGDVRLNQFRLIRNSVTHGSGIINNQLIQDSAKVPGLKRAVRLIGLGNPIPYRPKVIRRYINKLVFACLALLVKADHEFSSRKKNAPDE